MGGRWGGSNGESSGKEDTLIRVQNREAKKECRSSRADATSSSSDPKVGHLRIGS